MAPEPHDVQEHDPAAINELARTTMTAVARFLTRGASDTGRWRVEYELENGEVRRVFTHHGPIGTDELAQAPA